MRSLHMALGILEGSMQGIIGALGSPTRIQVVIGAGGIPRDDSYFPVTTESTQDC